MKKNSSSIVKILGYASGAAANNIDCALGPWYMYYHQILFNAISTKIEWVNMFEASSVDSGINVMPLVKNLSRKLAESVIDLTQQQQKFCVFGGDHSSAIGTWSGYAHAKRELGDIGVIWIDAHMDCHTPCTSETQNIHGMPLAHLLGHGDASLVKLFGSEQALKPENVCLIGIRSYESGEAKLLQSLGVKIFFIEDVFKLGIGQVLRQAYQHVSRHTCSVGISLDLDGIDPIDAPGVGCPAVNGIRSDELIAALRTEINDKGIMAAEIVEYNPIQDIDKKTAKLAVELFDAIFR